MNGYVGKSAGGALAGAVYLAASLSLAAVAQGAPPNFAADASIGWYAYNRQFIPPPNGPSERRALLSSAPQGPMAELICADNPNAFFAGQSVLPVPQAGVPDF